MDQALIPAAEAPAPAELIERRIYVIRSLEVMVDSDLAGLYQVPTKALNQAVKRNIERFPEDFMFRLTSEEAAAWNRSQFVTGSRKHRNPRMLPYAFTEHGVAMLSSVLSSTRAIQMNIAIVRTFVKLRRMLAGQSALAHRIEKVEAKQKDHATVLSIVVNDIETLSKNVRREFRELQSPRRRRSRIGFITDQK